VAQSRWDQQSEVVPRAGGHGLEGGVRLANDVNSRLCKESAGAEGLARSGPKIDAKMATAGEVAKSAAAASIGFFWLSFVKSISSWMLGLAAIALFASACATPVGVKRIDEQSAHRELNANILSAGKLSAYSTQLLERNALGERFKSEPGFVLAELNSGLGKPDENDRLFALSELSFAHAEESEKRFYYLASTAYVYAFLFPNNPADAPGPYDPRLRLAPDLYNRGIALGLATRDGKEVDLAGRQLELPFGSLTLEDDLQEFSYAGNPLTKFVSLADLKVRGLRNTYRQAGIGAALMAKVEPSPNNPARRWIPPNAKVPITAFVRFDDPRLAMSDGCLHGTVELYEEDTTGAVQVGIHSVPLELDPSAALAYRLTEILSRISFDTELEKHEKSGPFVATQNAFQNFRTLVSL
jgi:hypothetical protein